MQTLALLHRWTGGIAGLLLAVLGLSGAILAWEDAWIGVPHAQDRLSADIPGLAESVRAAVADSESRLLRLTFADEDLGLHLAIYEGERGAYLSQAGEVVSRWSSKWERPEIWLFDLHHHLLLAETGETVAGILGLLGLFFAISGILLWWRTRRLFAFRLWPARLTRSAIVRHHRDLGIVLAPVLLVSTLTGAAMIFPAISATLLLPWASPSAPPAPALPTAGPVTADTDWEAMLTAAKRQFPRAALRRLQLPRQAGAPLVLRLKQPFEWTPNGRTYVYLDPATARTLAVEDPAGAGIDKRIEEKFYPVHSAEVGGIAWKIAITLAGLGLALLGSLAVFSFWSKGAGKPRRDRSPAAAAGR